MATTYSTAAKNARMNAVVSQIGANGKIKFFTAADVLLATFTLAATAGVVSGSGLLTFSDNNGATAGILNTTASGNGTATKATVTTSADVDVITGLTVGTTGTDFIVDNPVLAVSQAVTVNSASIQHAA